VETGGLESNGLGLGEGAPGGRGVSLLYEGRGRLGVGGWADDGPKWPLGGGGCLGPLSGLPLIFVPGRAGPRAWGSAQARPEPRAGPARARVSSGHAGFVSGFFFVLRVVHGQVYMHTSKD
jgi:hypothetical protein